MKFTLNIRINRKISRSLIYRLIITVISIVLVQTKGVSQVQGDEFFYQLTVKDGLSQSTIYFIKEDSEGFIWIGTKDGLNRYDGSKFTVFRNKKGDNTSISDNRVNALVEDSLGNLWVGTENGLNYYNKLTGKFQQFLNDPTDPYSINNIHIRSLLMDKRGQLWIGTDGGGICYYEKDKNRFRTLFAQFEQNNLNGNVTVITMVESDNNEIWIGTKGEGVYAYNYRNQSVRGFSVSSGELGLLSDYIRVLYNDTKGNTWIGTDEHGLTRYNHETGVYKQFTSSKSGLSHNGIRAVYEDIHSNMWIGTRIGLNKINTTGTITQYFGLGYTNGELSNNSVRAILQDRAGNLWFGTYYGGINLLYASSQNFHTYTINQFDANSLSYQIVSSFSEAPNGDIWIGTEGGGIDRFQKSTSKFINYRHWPGDKNSLVKDNVKSIYADGSIVYIGTYGGGLDIFDSKKGVFTNYQHSKNDPTTISSNYVYSIFKDSKQRIWIGTNFGWLNQFDVNKKTFNRIKPLDEKGKPILGHTVNSIVEDSLGNIWLGTLTGLVKFNGETYQRVLLLPSIKGVDQEINVFSLYIDKFHTIWVGTEANGLIAYNINTQEAKSYSEDQEFMGSNIYGIVGDSKENLWMSTNGGLLKFPLSIHYKGKQVAAQNITIYNATDGLQGDEFNRGASYKASDGCLYFGGLNGFSYSFPDEILQNKIAPPVKITEFYLANKKIESYGEGSVLDKPVSKTMEITLEHNQSSFSFGFVALNYNKPNKNNYAYMLEGFEEEWVQAGKNNRAVYTNIDPGTYNFKVIASNNDNIWNTVGQTIKIVVKPPYWKTKFAFIVYFVVLILGLLLFRRIVISRIKQDNLLENERLEKKRIEEINQMKLRFFTNISHEFRTPLTLISGPIDKLRSNKEISDKELHYLVELMHKNVRRLQRLIAQLMDFRKLENQKLTLAVSQGNFVSFVEEITQVFKEFCKQKNIKLTVQSDLAGEHQTWFDKNIFDNIIFILLSNATKFTPEKGSITVAVKHDTEETTVKVSDTGIGIPQERISRIFERFYTDNSLTYTKTIGTGIGLSFAQNLVHLHKGVISVNSTQGKGTTFTITFPSRKSAYTQNEINENNTYVGKFTELPMANVFPEPEGPEATGELEESLLIVEDNNELRAFIKGHFKSTYKIFEAENGKEAVRLAKKQMPDIIVSDVMMPEMDGIEFCKEVKKNLITSHIPVILLTAKVNVENKIEGAESGADLYIEKPFSTELLEANIKNILQQRKALRERYSAEISAGDTTKLLHKVEDDFFNKVQQIISERKSEPEFSVEELGRELGLSRSQLFRKFKSLTKHTPNEFIKIMRLKYAVELMVSSDMNINQISLECGFSSASHFIASFKKHYNKTPKEYANLIIKRKTGKGD